MWQEAQPSREGFCQSPLPNPKKRSVAAHVLQPDFSQLLGVPVEGGSLHAEDEAQMPRSTSKTSGVHPGTGQRAPFSRQAMHRFRQWGQQIYIFFQRLLTQLAGVQQGQPTTCAADHAEPPVSGAYQEDALCHLSCHTWPCQGTPWERMSRKRPVAKRSC